MTEFTYTVTHDPNGSATVISTNDVETVEVTLEGTGSIKSAKLRLNAENGKFLTTTPVIQQFDKFRIEITDEDSKTLDHIFEVDTITPIESIQEGVIAEIGLLGEEHFLMKTFFAKQYFFDNAKAVVEDLANIYNDNLPATTTMPTIEDHTDITKNILPTWTTNHYDFNIAEKTVYDAMVDVVDRLGNTVQAGGAADFFELFFEKGSAADKISLRAFSSGSLPTAGSEITITDADAVNEDPTEGGIEAVTGTIYGTWGAEGFGTQPTDAATFNGELEAFNLHPDWVSGVTYPKDARVKFTNGSHYQSNIDSNTSTPPTNWTVKVISDILGSSQYSPWTEDKVALWINAGADQSAVTGPAGSTFTSTGASCFDGNLVIHDGVNYRTWVDMREKDPLDASTFWKYGSNNTGEYRGFRILADPAIGAMGGVFASNDKNGKAFSGNIAEYDGADWVVIRVTANNEQVAVIEEAKVYEKQTGTWTDVSASTNRANDCFHQWNTIKQDDGYVSTDDGAGGTYGDNSAVKYQWDFTGFDTIFDELFTTAGYYKIGAWANFRFPYPITTQNSITETIGQLYGNNATKKEPVTLDANNMHLSHSGNIGFNHSEAEELGVLDALQFHIRFRYTLGGVLEADPLQGDFQMRCFMYDTNDNVVFQDFKVDFNNHWEQKTLPISGFKIYRGRLPLRWGNIQQNLFLRELNILDVFQWKNIKQVVIQLDEVYDDEGRYSPESGPRFTAFAVAGGRIELYIDAFHFTKPLLSVTDPITNGRAIMPKFGQQTEISNKVQLDQSGLSQLEIEQFQHRFFTIRTEGKIDINYGDTFFLNKADLINDKDTRTEDTGGVDNTIRLVAKRIIYRITKPSNSPGGFIRILTGVKRII